MNEVESFEEDEISLYELWEKLRRMLVINTRYLISLWARSRGSMIACGATAFFDCLLVRRI